MNHFCHNKWIEWSMHSMLAGSSVIWIKGVSFQRNWGGGGEEFNKIIWFYLLSWVDLGYEFPGLMCLTLALCSRSAVETPYKRQFTLSTQLIKPNYLHLSLQGLQECLRQECLSHSFKLLAAKKGNGMECMLKVTISIEILISQCKKT